MPKVFISDLQRLLSKITVNGECWEWNGFRSNEGYGQFKFKGKDALAHRASYILHIGPIPPGLTIDHLCRNTSCVNPGHLEAVTIQENLSRGNGFQNVNRAKTHCNSGHAFSPENTYIFRGGRYCRACNRRNAREYARRQRAQ